VKLEASLLQSGESVSFDFNTTVHDEVVQQEESGKVTEDRGDLQEKIQQFLREEFALVLKLPAAKIEVKAPLERYGIDSILAMDLTARLEKTFGTLPKTLFFEYQSIAELSAYFVQQHAAKFQAAKFQTAKS